MRRYRIVAKGEFGALLSNAFSECQVKTSGGETILTADVVDSSGLYGILDRLRDLAVDVVDFHEVKAPTP